MRRRDFLLGSLVLPTLMAAEFAIPYFKRPEAASQTGKAEAAATPFDAQLVRHMARELAANPFQPPDRQLPKELDELGYDQWRDIRFDPPQAVWHGEKLPFEMQFFHRGFLYKDRVEIALVKNGMAERVAFRQDYFRFEHGFVPPKGAEQIGFSGLRLHAPLNRPDVFDEAVVFQGASYFRGLAKGQTYGASARGLALKTADAGGEEFPVFKAFWVEQPQAGVDSIVVHALLDSESASAAYRFTIRPGDNTLMSVEMALYPRVDIDQAGIGTLTSMYLFAPNDRSGFDDFRPAVHDSDGLQVLTGKGERLWRPLSNPQHLEVSVLNGANVRGFGLMQRQRSFFEYQDMESHFEKRPSVWVEPLGDWGEGAVHLVEIPVTAEIHDNIVAFWRPKDKLGKGGEYLYNYRIHWCWDGPDTAAIGRVGSTRIGGTAEKRLFVLDFASESIKNLNPAEVQARVASGGGKIANPVVQANPEIGGLRLSFALEPQGETLAELSAQLLHGDQPITETWLYRWTA